MASSIEIMDRTNGRLLHCGISSYQVQRHHRDARIGPEFGKLFWDLPIELRQNILFDIVHFPAYATEKSVSYCHTVTNLINLGNKEVNAHLRIALEHSKRWHQAEHDKAESLHRDALSLDCYPRVGMVHNSVYWKLANPTLTDLDLYTGGGFTKCLDRFEATWCAKHSKLCHTFLENAGHVAATIEAMISEAAELAVCTGRRLATVKEQSQLLAVLMKGEKPAKKRRATTNRAR